MHKTIEPAILYMGTPVSLITTRNVDETVNVAPNSSLFWLGWSCMIGLDASSKTTENLLRTRRCVLNMASSDMAKKVNEIALFTGSEDIPLHKKLLGYSHAKDKLQGTGLTTAPCIDFSGDLIEQCPIQLEAEVVNVHRFGEADNKMAVPALTIELKICRIHAAEEILLESNQNKIDPQKWNPLIMSFRQFFGLVEAGVKSRLNTGDEDLYAPWKMRGILGFATRLALSMSVRSNLKT